MSRKAVHRTHQRLHCSEPKIKLFGSTQEFSTTRPSPECDTVTIIPKPSDLETYECTSTGRKRFHLSPIVERRASSVNPENNDVAVSMDLRGQTQSTPESKLLEEWCVKKGQAKKDTADKDNETIKPNARGLTRRNATRRLNKIKAKASTTSTLSSSGSSYTDDEDKVQDTVREAQVGHSLVEEAQAVYASSDTSDDPVDVWTMYNALSEKLDTSFEVVSKRVAETARRAQLVARARLERLQFQLNQMNAAQSPRTTLSGVRLRPKKKLPLLPRPGSIRWRPPPSQRQNNISSTKKVNVSAQPAVVQTHHIASTGKENDNSNIIVQPPLEFCEVSTTANMHAFEFPMAGPLILG